MGLLYGSFSRTWPVPTPARVALIMVMMAGVPAWVVVRDWPYRAHWILPLVAGVAGAATLAGVRTETQAWEWQRLVGLLGGLSIAVAGLLDHALLLKALGNGRALEVAQADPQLPAS
jgi:hypothetical protein